MTFDFQNQSLLGTLGYRAPETYFGNDWRSQIDVWSLGCILAECHTGKVLFSAKSEARYLQLVAEILGLPSDHMFKKWKFIHNFFELNSDEEWVFKNKDVSCGEPGCKNFFDATKSRFGTHEMRLMNLLSRMIHYDPDDRINSTDALKHLLFATCKNRDLKIAIRKYV